MARSYEYSGHYFDTGVFLNPGVATPVWQVFNLSSLYDPDTTGAGHQPMGFDQFMPLYDHYTVHRASVRISACTEDALYGQIVCLHLSDSSSPPSNIRNAIENGRTVYKLIGPKAGGTDTISLTMDVDHSLFFGKSVFFGDKYQGTSSTSPSESVFLHIGVQGFDVTNTAGVYVWTDLLYSARLTEPRLLAES